MSPTEFLAGIRIVTMAMNVPGPLAVARMKQAGASVTKIEPPMGDPLLALSPAWHAEMHNGIAIERVDLRTDAGRARVALHLRDADVFLTSQRPSLLGRHSLDRDTLRSQLPGLRVLRILGSVGEPELPGHDLTYQAQVGLVGDQMPRTLAADVLGSERVFAGVLVLLRQLPGSTLDVGLIESLDPLLAPLRHGLTAPNGALGGGAPQYGLYDAKLGRVAVAALEPHFESRLYQDLGVAPRAELSSRFRERSADEWEVWARERDLPIVAVRDVDRSGGPSSR
jgi:crotonobetainyl-CoA:carnitine CoA-transferase CaiB-like acyl-CoA transferase